ncbi:MAG: type 1 periplasmic-binding domain-containing protein [Acidimicrobiales bacterium]|jgi:hypothetical protein
MSDQLLKSPSSRPAGREKGEPVAVVRGVLQRYSIAAVAIVIAVLLANLLPSVFHSRNSASSSASVTPSNITPAAAPGTPGITVGGVKCGPGVRQVPWSHYAPICVPKWTGNNGGATAPGVTRTTITLTYREAASSELQALYSLVPPSAIGTNSEGIATMQAYINTFNKEFELYGRKVVLKPFVGKGDFISEFSGQDQTGAQEDAVTAKSLGAFADSSVLDATTLYERELARQGVIGLTIYGAPTSFFQRYSPYLYTTGTVCSKTVAQTVQLVGRTLNKTPVSFAGGGLNGRKRVFGFIGYGNSEQQACNQEIVSQLKSRYGITVSPVITMALNGNELQNEAATAIAKLKSAGVTTILCSTCDFITPIYLTKAADTQGYYPEWIQTDLLDSLTALQSSAQLAHTEGFGSQVLPKQATEAYHAFKLGAPPGEHIIPSFSYVYEPLLMFFDALQAAGPDLTPATFQKGFRSLPPSTPGGMYGGWAFNSNSFDPNASYSMAAWSNTAVNAVDGIRGSWVNCNNGSLYNYNGTPPQLPIGKELNCPKTG